VFVTCHVIVVKCVVWRGFIYEENILEDGRRRNKEEFSKRDRSD
jgi:hypothetical protein